MIKGELAHRFDSLVADRVPFVLATVVRTAKPTSVRPGDATLCGSPLRALRVFA